MSDNKNIDQLLNNLDLLLSAKEEPPAINIEIVAQKYHEKKLLEKKGNSRMLIGTFFLGVSIFLLSPDTIARINMIILGVLMSISYWLNYKAKREIESQNLAVSLNEFKNQRKKIALASSKQFKGMKVAFYSAMLLSLAIDIYDYINEPSILKLVIYIISLSLGGFLVVRSIESGIKEYEELAKAQD